MAKITFFGGKMSTPEVLTVDMTSTPQSLTEIVREQGLPLYWRCGHGTCGACAVHLHFQNRQASFSVRLSNKEKNVMLRHQLISKEAHAEEQIVQTNETWRLACHVYPDQLDDLLVTW